MKISIITVCYNSDKTIESTIESVRKQNYENIEYIVIDGGSTDNTVRIIEDNLDVIDVWISELDKGLYDAMNKGIDLSTGDIIGIINSDDTFYNKNVIEDLVVFHSKKNVDASIGNIVQHDKLGKIKRTYSSKKWHPKKLKIGYMPPHPSIFFKKDLFNKFEAYKLDYIIGADYELITRFFLKHEITWAYSGITTTAMLIGGVSSSGFKSYKKITEEIQKALRDNNISFSKLKITGRFFWKLKELL